MAFQEVVYLLQVVAGSMAPPPLSVNSALSGVTCVGGVSISGQAVLLCDNICLLSQFTVLTRMRKAGLTCMASE